MPDPQALNLFGNLIEQFSLDDAEAFTVPALLWAVFDDAYVRLANYGRAGEKPETLWLLRIPGRNGEFAIVYREIAQTWTHSTLLDSEFIFLQSADGVGMTDGPRLNDGEYDVQMVVKAHPTRRARPHTWLVLGGAEYGPLEENRFAGYYFMKLYHRKDALNKFVLRGRRMSYSERSLGWKEKKYDLAVASERAVSIQIVLQIRTSGTVIECSYRDNVGVLLLLRTPC
ncbi:hypothetical protein LTR56_012554 [Elasticomyces elasticus]|nr:hypothetical protein LTR22_022898 [Elasticomyces elasticus]KAK3639194.1 hypothetical protein LTR56_012554 [Elasticomyces elasticus]KAK4924888.1 hypothetical protein LTR49_008109 [Elasticomyces elasticus]KAK5746751.1 hypothetical protein LTS12_022601 [Elasticomyces elasticus]